MSAEDTSPSRTGPLLGYKVLELGSTAAGPFCTRLLADFGAEVVKIEAAEGDPIRKLGQTVDGKSLYAASICRNKTIASLDLRKPEAQVLLKRMIPEFDAVVENFRPGTLENWGLGYDDLKLLRPDLVMTRISGYGQYGPYRDRPGYGVIGEAMSGLRSLIGDPDRPPSRVAMPLTDYITALYAALGTVMALLAREKTGVGQIVDTSLVDSAFSFMESSVPDYEKTGAITMRAGARLPNSAPNSLYSTRDGKFIHIAALADPVYRRLAGAMKMPHLATDPRFSEQNVRSENVDQIDEIVADWTKSHDLEEVERILEAASVPASRIFTMADIFRDPHFSARDMLLEVPDDDLGTVTLAGVVPKLSKTPGSVLWSGHRTGQDTREILRRFARLSDQEIDTLERDKIVFCEPQQGDRAIPATATL
ncbi:MAG: CoA transferase [Bradyrhizobium sp.]|uniref:CaiB/BaiF CoA transferase family protein n=1 Tax=Bradyrhizobium sp. TaxID=376 RepID=UPI00120F5539|nr:CoA transferase [Bradyrhizobium sp.]THD63171.1 MAG: CoA transferase [Bradyrhizobium sp.]